MTKKREKESLERAARDPMAFLEKAKQAGLDPIAVERMLMGELSNFTMLNGINTFHSLFEFMNDKGPKGAARTLTPLVFSMFRCLLDNPKDFMRWLYAVGVPKRVQLLHEPDELDAARPEELVVKDMTAEEYYREKKKKLQEFREAELVEDEPPAN